MLVPTAKNDRFRFFRRGSVVDPCGRVDTRPYEAGSRRRARGYAPLQGAASAGAWIRAPTRLAIVGGRVDTHPYEALRFGTLAQPISILPQGDRKFSILHSQFSIQRQGLGLNCYLRPCYAVFRAAACFSRRSVLY